MVKGLAQVFRAAAGAHVKAMRRESRPQGRGAQAPYVASLPRPLQAVDHEDLAARLAVGPLRAHQYLHVRLGTVQPAFDGKLRRRIRTPPKVGGDGLQVRTAQQRLKGNHERRLYLCAILISVT